MVKLFLPFKMGLRVFPGWSQIHLTAKGGLELELSCQHLPSVGITSVYPPAWFVCGWGLKAKMVCKAGS